ncbi:MFS transporter [Streptomyces beihaiensis]|uniref:MFS transporter n=1 Tax=Streptomyces beihaiensis TaxID=2984495 RepID=A0ABT3TXR9_9ACTN|nr:MFS transporter [Streptomyces beihaiensis]MCX3061814.1 MFS transporter [Streptomyces beihaiensis]
MDAHIQSLPAPRVPADRRRAARPLAVLAAVHLALNLSVSVTFAAGPAIQRDLGLNRTDLVLASAAYGLGFSGLLLLGARLTDRSGRRAVFSFGVGLFAVASVAVALAPGPWPLLAARFLQGCGAAMAAPAAMALLRTVFPDGPARTSATVLWGLLASLGAASGIVLSGALANWASWRWSFAVPAVVGGFALALTRRFLPVGPPARRVPVDVLGALLGTGALIMLGCGCALVSRYGWSSGYVLGLLTAGALMLGAFAAAERRVRAPLLPPGFLASRTRATAVLCAMFAPGTGAATAFLLGLYWQQTRGRSALDNAEMFLPYTVVLLGVGMVAGPAVGRCGARAVAVGGAAAAAAGLYVIGGLGVRADSTPLVLVGLAFVATGVGSVVSAAVERAAAGAADRDTALVGAVVNTAVLAGPTLGVALATSAAQSRTAALAAAGVPSPAVGGYVFAFEALATAAVVVCAVAAYGLRPRRRAGEVRTSVPVPSRGWH